MTARRSARLALLALAAALAVPSSAQAQTPRIYCSPGGLNCFGFKYELAPYADDAHPLATTRFTFWLQNLQGSFWESGPNPDIFQLFEITRNNPERDEKHLVVRTDFPPIGIPEGNVVAGGAVVWDLDGCAQDQGTFCTRFAWRWIEYGGFYGCTLSPGGLDFIMWQTCPRDGIDGWVRFNTYLGFDGCCATALPSEVALDDFRLYVKLASDNGCEFFGEDANLGYTPQVCPNYTYALTPEPGAAVLLGSIFGGFGIAGVFRRRHARRSRRAPTE